MRRSRIAGSRWTQWCCPNRCVTNRIPASEATSKANSTSSKENLTPTSCPPRMISASNLLKITTSPSQSSLKSGLPSSRRDQPRVPMWPNSRLICDISVFFTGCMMLKIGEGLLGTINASKKHHRPILMNDHHPSISLI